VVLHPEQEGSLSTSCLSEVFGSLVELAIRHETIESLSNWNIVAVHAKALVGCLFGDLTTRQFEKRLPCDVLSVEISNRMS
jgi:hypothetical protein